MRVVLAVDAFVFPNRACAGGGQRGGVRVIGHGVYRQKNEAFAVAAIHPQFEAVHALLAPTDDRMTGLLADLQDRFEAGVINRLFRADDAQILSHGLGVGGMFLDARGEGAVARKNSRRHGGGRGRQCGRARQISQGVAVGGGGFVGRPIARGFSMLRVGVADVIEKCRIGGGLRDFGGRHAHGGGVSRQFGREVGEPFALARLVAGTVL